MPENATVGDVCRWIQQQNNSHNVRALFTNKKGRTVRLETAALARTYIARERGSMFFENDAGQRWAVYTGLFLVGLWDNQYSHLPSRVVQFYDEEVQRIKELLENR